MRILFVGMPGSIHTSRWLAQLQETGWDIHLFPSTLEVPTSELGNITVHDVQYTHLARDVAQLEQHVRIDGVYWSRLKYLQRLPRGRGIMSHLMRRVKPQWGNPTWRLAQTVRHIKPDLIHSLEIQHAGYITHTAKQYYGSGFPHWIVSNWGSDLYLFGRMAEHQNSIKSVLTSCDYYLCECNRDIALGHEFGFEKEVLPVLPVAGGHNLKRMRQLREPIPTAQKRLIVLKGYQHWAGRALVGLHALELCADLIKEKGYRVVINNSTPDVKIAAEFMSYKTGIPVNLIPYSPHDDILRLHGKARISIGLSISDAISTSLLEAMIMGSFPIQSNTGCGNEWIDDGKTGILVPPEDPNIIAEAIRRALTDDQLVDQATEITDRRLDERLDESVIRPQVIAMYEKIADQIGVSHRRTDES